MKNDEPHYRSILNECSTSVLCKMSPTLLKGPLCVCAMEALGFHFSLHISPRLASKLVVMLQIMLIGPTP